MEQRIFDKSEGLRAITWLSNLIPTLKDKRYVITVKEYKQKRSLDANAYCWTLIDKLAEKLHKTLKQDKSSVKEQIYQSAIRDIGGVSDIVCVPDKSVDKIKEAWQKHGIGWQAVEMPSKLPNCTNVCLYYGSSVYNTQQMSWLIDNIVQECKAQGIETMTPKELEALKQEWK